MARSAWAVLLGVCGFLIVYGLWLIATDAPSYRFVVRLFVDKHFLKRVLREWGVLAPVVFVALQALQVIVSPIPGDVTGFLGGYLFGEWLGLFYSTIGLTAGSLVAFGVGRMLGTRYVQRLVSHETWEKLGFIVEAEGTILCFVIYLIPGLPKDIVCYLFGISPMPLWLFAIASTLGRLPGTWFLSAQGAHTASGDYLEVILVSVIVVAVALPFYYRRSRIVAWLRRRRRPGGPTTAASR